MNDTKPKFADLIARRDRRLANARRLYNEELPEAALNVFADWQENPSLGATQTTELSAKVDRPDAKR
jgi:hypothetical protein